MTSSTSIITNRYHSNWHANDPAIHKGQSARVLELDDYCKRTGQNIQRGSLGHNVPIIVEEDRILFVSSDELSIR